jgi:molybdopterin-binding protein
MNILPGIISDIEVCNDLSLVHIACGSVSLRSIIIDTPQSADYLVVGNKIDVLFKETELIISTESTLAISLRNQFPSTIKKITEGQLLSSVCLQFEGHEIISIITSNAVNSLGLKEGMAVLGLVKTNELMLAKK